jgi:hypothetical protein
MTRRPFPVLAALAALALASACSSSSSSAGPAPTASAPPLPTAASCSVAAKPHFAWPKAVPADLPQPPSSVFRSVSTSADGVTVVRLSSGISLQQSVLFVLNEVQKAGYTLGRGDAEPAEADAPFGKGTVRGIYKMVTVDQCSTDWLIAVAPARFNSGSPLLPKASPGPSSSPLPFG